MPLRLVGSGSSSTVIRRVLLIVSTSIGDDYDGGTNDQITLEIKTSSTVVFSKPLPATPQPDLEAGSMNWYGPYDALPFTRGDLLADGAEITLSTRGDDAWLPYTVFVVGFDTADGRPTEIVTLVSIPQWTLGYLSTDDTEGKTSVRLPVI